jgi:hypothetical protein
MFTTAIRCRISWPLALLSETEVKASAWSEGSVTPVTLLNVHVVSRMAEKMAICSVPSVVLICRMTLFPPSVWQTRGLQ